MRQLRLPLLAIYNNNILIVAHFVCFKYLISCFKKKIVKNFYVKTSSHENFFLSGTLINSAEIFNNLL